MGLNPDEVQAKINSTLVQLSSGAIDHIEIIYLPTYILTRAAVLPEQLDAWWHYKLVIAKLPESRKFNSLRAALKSITVLKTSDSQPDLRWACGFYDKNGKRIQVIYVAGNGRAGVVENTPVLLKGDFHSWLRSNFGSCFE